MRRDRIEKIKKRIEVVVKKIQQLGKVNRPLTFRSPEKYPENKKPEQIKHSAAARYASIFAQVPENKELLHLPEQLSKLILSTESELKELVEATRGCYDSKSFSTIASNVSLTFTLLSLSWLKA